MIFPWVELRPAEALKPEKILYMVKEEKLKSKFRLFIKTWFDWLRAINISPGICVSVLGVPSVETLTMRIRILSWEAQLHHDAFERPWGCILCGIPSFTLCLHSALDILYPVSRFESLRVFSTILESGTLYRLSNVSDHWWCLRETDSPC